MLTIPGYRTLENIYEDSCSLYYRAGRVNDNLPVVLRILKDGLDCASFTARYRHDLEISCLLHADSIVTPYALENVHGLPVLVLEDFGGIPVKKLISERRLTMDEAVSLAAKAAGILDEIHRKNIIHKNISSSCFIFNRETGQLKISDFSISTALIRETPAVTEVDITGSALAYISPEQTGRMNRSLDYRTDLYSFGVTLYEWFTGRLPFESEDPLELVHCHIAKQPAPPHQIDASVPEAVSAVVMKLLSKAPEDRYQSALGLQADMEECRRHLRETGHIDGFIPGRFDISEKLNITEKLYGRKREIAFLLSAFDRASRGQMEILLVSGYPGVGKSALVNEAGKPIRQRKGYFISGKFDQIRRNIAYSAIVEAFRDLIRQILGEDEQRLKEWREEMLSVLAPNEGIIIDLIPEVKLILGSREPVHELGPLETRNRFNIVFLDFLKIFTRRDHPLVLFLDDLQWADSASLELIELIAADNRTNHFLLIGAYRSNGVDDTHAAMAAMERIRKAGGSIHNIALPPLDIDDISHLIADTLNSAGDEVASLVDAVYRKTEGNPFFTKIFLHSLYDKRILHFTHDAGWRWDTDEINRMEATENVIRLMIDRINSLPEAAREMLKLSSCLGNPFNLEYLVIITGKTMDEILSDMQAVLNAGMVIMQSENSCRFVHDSIQEAAYSLIPDESKPAAHLMIGQALLKGTTEEEFDRRLFVITEQLNAGHGLMERESDRVRLAELNLRAGKKSKSSAAFEESLRYLRTASGMLPENSWDRHFRLTMDIHTERAEAEYLNTNFEAAEELFDIIIARTGDPVGKTRIYEIKIDLYTMQNKFPEAVYVGLKALEMLGVNLLKDPSPSLFIEEINKIRSSVEHTEVRELINRPVLTDPYKAAAMRILLHTWTPAYVGVAELAPLLVAKMTSLSLEHGHTPASSLAYSCYGALLSGVMGDFDSAYEFGTLSRRLMEKFNAVDMKCRIFFNIAVFINHWKKGMRSSLDYLEKGYHDGFRRGDLQFASYSINHYQILSILAGKRLDDVESAFSNLYGRMLKAKQEDAILWFRMFREFVLNLKGRPENKLRLDGHEFSEDDVMHIWIRANNLTTLSGLYIVKAILCYLYGEYPGALDCCLKAREYIKGVTGMALVPVHNFFYSLTLAALYRSAPEAERDSYLEQINKNQESMSVWAENCPENYMCKYLLVDAELAAILNPRTGKAEKTFDEAIKAAAGSENLFDLALANELAAIFRLNNASDKAGRERALYYMTEAYNTYTLWGAYRKAKDIEERYGYLIKSPAVRNTSAETASAPRELLDINTVIKASQAISGEIHLDKLIAKMMGIIIENAGAQKGLLVLEKNDRLYIEASVSVGPDKIEVLQAVPVDNSPDLSEAIVRQVFRTGDNVLLNNASEEGVFIYDPYIVKNRPRSILCTPIRHKDHVMGVLYLENNLAADVFTEDRIELLNVLLAQAAISLDNARLFEERKRSEEELERHRLHLEELVKERTKELEAKTENLKRSEQTLIYLLEDVNEIRADLEKANEKLKELDRLKSMFIASMSHELRTPLNSIIGFTGLVLQGMAGEINEEQRDQLQRVYASAKHLLLLITDVIDISKIEVGEIEVFVEEFSLRDVLKEAVSSLRTQIDEKGLEVEVDVSPEIRLRTDSRRLLQCILNYLSNAVKFTERGSVRIRARRVQGSGVGVQGSEKPAEGRPRAATEDFVEISVTDTGIGIKEEELPKLFNSFVRLDSHLKIITPGTGLGLYLTKKLATEVLGGYVYAESRYGEGSTFVLRIPEELDPFHLKHLSSLE